jgi:hypothetical protein
MFEPALNNGKIYYSIIKSMVLFFQEIEKYILSQQNEIQRLNDSMASSNKDIQCLNDLN